MKKFLTLLCSLLVSATMIASMTACGGTEADPSDASVASVASEATPDTTATYIEVPAKIVNMTGVDLYNLQISPSSQNSWGSDLLGGNYFSTETYYDVLFQISTAMTWDLRVTDKDGNYLEFYNLDFSQCSVEGITVTLNYDFDTQTGTASVQ